MAAKWIFLVAFSFACACAHSQLNKESSSRVHLKGFGFVRGTNTLHLPGSQTCGVYSTLNDRQSGTLSVAVDCRSENHRIRSGFIRDKGAIKIIRDENTYSYLRRDLYGYRDCKGNEYHFYDGKSYQLINQGESIRIYRFFEWRGKQRVAKHFFSKETADTIKPLTLENLRTEFSDEPLFLQKLSVLAGNDFQLIKYLHLIDRVYMNSSQDVAAKVAPI